MKKIVINLKKAKVNKFFLLILLFVILIFIILIFAISYKILKVRPQKINASYVLIKSNKNEKISFENIIEPLEVKEIENPINGELLTHEELKKIGNKKILCVMVENSISARPQSGISDADFVYESLVESGITRYMLVFYSKESKKIGPVRSIRTYYLDWAAEYDNPIIDHIGWAGYGENEAVIVPEADAISYIYKYKPLSMFWYGRKVNYRDMEKFKSGKAWEHVAYTNTKILWDDAQKMNWTGTVNLTKYEFKKQLPFENRPLSQFIEIKFSNLGGEAYNVKWSYERKTNSYKRFIGGIEDIDENTNENILAKNIILQYTKYRPTGDKNGRVVFTTIGEGKADFLIDGKRIEGTWRKDDRTSRTLFFTSDGKPMQFNRGKFWVEIIPLLNGKPLGRVIFS